MSHPTVPPFRGTDRVAVRHRRIEEVAADPDAIPGEAAPAYRPSGRSTPGAPWRMVLGGAAGALLGFGAAHLVRWLAEGVFGIFAEAGGCLGLVYYPAVAAYYLCPVAIPIAAGGGVAMGARWGHCRNPEQARRIGLAVALAAGAVAVWMELALARNAVEVITLGSPSLWMVLVVAVVALMSLPGAGWVLGVALAAFGAFVARDVACDGVEGDRYCEPCQRYLETEVLARYPVELTGAVVLALLRGDGEALSRMPRLPEKDSWSDDDHRLELAHGGCSCGETNFVEATAHWTAATDGKTASAEKRRVLSESFDAAEMAGLREALGGRTAGV